MTAAYCKGGQHARNTRLAHVETEVRVSRTGSSVLDSNNSDGLRIIRQVDFVIQAAHTGARPTHTTDAGRRDLFGPLCRPRVDPAMLTGSNLLHTKQFNLRTVHETVRLFGPLSRADVARHTALTGQTVSNLVRELIDLGLVIENARRIEGRGAPSTDLTINPDGAFSIGLDFNRDHLTGVLLDLAGTVRQRANIDIELPTPDQALDLMVNLAESLIARQGISRDRVCGVGIGVPGLMHPAPDHGSYVVTPTAFPGWHDVPLATWLHERLHLPVILENNATAAAVGERRYGAGRSEIDTFFYVFLGSGLGGGLIVNGRPYEGATGNAGEIGYIPSVLRPGANGDEHAGLRFNVPHLFERLRAAGADARSPADLDALFTARHPELLAWMDAAAEHLTWLVLAVEYLIDPQAIIFGGRIPERMLAYFRDEVARALPARRMGTRGTVPQLLLATAGADAAALGVATLPIEEFFAPAPRVLLKQSKHNHPMPGLNAARTTPLA